MIIAVIDDGVNSDFYKCDIKLEFDLEIGKSNEIEQRAKYNKACCSHGTTCAAIIKKYAPNARLGSIKILSNKTGRGKAEHLVNALKWCAQNNIKIAHMSVGSSLVMDIESISEAVKQFQDNGGIIVSALTNTMKWSIPACLPGVIGVRTDKELEGEQYRAGGVGLYEVPFVASSKHSVVDRFGAETITQCSNSYSAPMITALVLGRLCDNPKDALMTPDELCVALGGAPLTSVEERIKNTSFLDKELEIPIISVCASIETCRELRAEMNRREYPCIICSDNEAEWVHHISREKNVNNQLAFYADMMDISAILLTSEDNAWSEGVSDCQIRSVCKRVKNKYDGDIIYIPNNPTKSNIKNAVSYLEKIGE